MTATCLTALWLMACAITAADEAVPAAGQAPSSKVSPGGQPKSIPLTLIIDDPAPCTAKSNPGIDSSRGPGDDGSGWPGFPGH